MHVLKESNALLTGASEESVKSARYSLQLLSQDFVQRQHAASIWSGLHELCMPPGLISAILTIL